jgi:hypothetical protein
LRLKAIRCINFGLAGGLLAFLEDPTLTQDQLVKGQLDKIKKASNRNEAQAGASAGGGGGRGRGKAGADASSEGDRGAQELRTSDGPPPLLPPPASRRRRRQGLM